MRSDGMRLAIMQPYIFPYLGYFQLISAVDKFVIYDDVNYINRGWINRNNILLNSKSFLFGIPLIDASQNKLINEIEIVKDEAWKIKLLKTFDQAYRRAPYFNGIFDLIVNVINSRSLNISDMAFLSIKVVVEYIGIDTEFVNTSNIYDNRNLRGQKRILDICEREKSEHYINPIGGLEIYSKELFEKSNIKLSFLRSMQKSYKQFNAEFVPNLSIIDLLMFNSKESLKEMLEEFELI
jgi:hypothetical protein